MKYGKNLVLKDKTSIFIEGNVEIGDNVTIYENNRIDGDTKIGNNVVILPGNFINSTEIGDNSVVNKSQTENTKIGKNCNIGPYARLRPNTVIGDGAKIGNFVEIKNSNIGKRTKISHLAYVGDADIGEDCNIGCGAIFVNYNGRTKNRTIVGNNSFIGSNCNIIAPVEIKDNTYICAGTTVTDNVNSDDFVIGRVRQQVKEGRAHLYLKEKKENK